MSKKKSSARSRTRAGSTRGAGRATRTRTAAPRAAGTTLAQVNEENDIDGCELDFTQGEVTPDSELPPAKGGVAHMGRRARRT